MEATRQSLYSYEGTLAAAQRVNWRLEDVIGDDQRLDFGRPFMPESLAQVEGLTFLSASEQRVLNQIRGNTYLAIFGLVEEFILPFVLDHTRARLDGEDHRVRALLQFAAEEAKHIHLFRRFRDEFARGFGSPCEVIGPPAAVGREILSHHPLAVALAILQIEWMTQRHYTDSVKDSRSLDPHFKSLLRHHWLEEAQHAKLDTLMVEALAETCTPAEIARAVDEYVEIGGFLDAGLGQQVELECQAFERATGRVLAADERAQLLAAQRRATRWTFLGSGMTHPNFLTTLGRIAPEGRARVEALAPTFS